MRVTRLEVDLDKFLNNIRLIGEHVPDKEIIPVIKANGYGTYVNRRLDVLKHFNIVAVACVDEGVSIRKLGYNGGILVLNQPAYEEIDLIKDNSLIIGLSDINFLQCCISGKDNIKVHLELETGMNRTGINIDGLESYLDLLSNSNIYVDGVYTHFSSADFDDIYTKRQIDEFRRGLDIISKRGFNLRYIHTSASNGVLKYNLDFTNAVRPGIIMYGYESFDGARSIIPVSGICKLKSKVVFLKKVSAGSAIGYSQKFICGRDSLIATIPIGYADGLPRSLSNRGFVYINDCKVPIIGNVCMDSIMIDVTDISDVKVLDDVYIFYDEETLEEYSKLCDTINYEALCTIGDRVCREFVGGKNE